MNNDKGVISDQLDYIAETSARALASSAVVVLAMTDKPQDQSDGSVITGAMAGVCVPDRSFDAIFQLALSTALWAKNMMDEITEGDVQIDINGVDLFDETKVEKINDRG